MTKINQVRSGVLPNFVIIGAGRCGTTSFARYLGAHPDIYMAAAKELRFFNTPSKDLAWYREQFVAARNASAIGEATPSYMYEPEAITRMAATIPNARLIVILRNPIDRAYSHYWQNRSLGKETMTFEDAIDDEPRRLGLNPSGDGKLPSYLNRGNYLPRLQMVTQHFPRESLLVLIFEDMIRDPLLAYATACQFLEVDDAFVPHNLSERINGYSEFRSLSIRRFARDLPHQLTTLGRVVARFNTRRNVRYPPLSPSVRAKLLGATHKGNNALAEWLGRDLSVWNK
jgi:hypothetical protein